MITFSLAKELLLRLAHKVEAQQGLLISLLAVLTVLYLTTGCLSML